MSTIDCDRLIERNYRVWRACNLTASYTVSLVQWSTHLLPIMRDPVQSPWGYLGETGILLLALSRYINDPDVVPDKRSRVLEVVIVRRIINLGTGNLEWGGKGRGLRKGRSVYEQPETKVDRSCHSKEGFQVSKGD